MFGGLSDRPLIPSERKKEGFRFCGSDQGFPIALDLRNE